MSQIGSVCSLNSHEPCLNSKEPRMRSFSVVTALPEEISRLNELAYNMWWVWNKPAIDLFERLDPFLWEKLSHNPVALLQLIDNNKLEELVLNRRFMQNYKVVIEDFDNYMKDTVTLAGDLGPISKTHPVAYFSMEFGIHESLPIYSGGLGILSGDHIKSASDLNLPFIGISLAYKLGYFNQIINQHGDQISSFDENKFSQMALKQVTNPVDGTPLTFTIPYPGRHVHVQVWRVDVGRAILYLLDTDVNENSPHDRDITSKLYKAGSDSRVSQEILLGIGGVTLLETLGVKPAVYHMNEGHSTFMTIERVRRLMHHEGLEFHTAKEVVRGSSIFTTHTPVPAGNDQFERGLVEHFFHHYITSMGINWDDFWSLGHFHGGDPSKLNMTVMALKMSGLSNGVAKLHGKVSRHMWKNIWSGFLEEEVPISSITNGVHLSSWMAKEIREVVSTFSALTYDGAQLDPNLWNKIDEIPNSKLWARHNYLKDKLFDIIKNVVKDNWIREDEAPCVLDMFYSRLNPRALTIGFARRFATYKRATLLLNNIERLKKILQNPKYPVQFVFAGKAHPADQGGQALIRELVRLSKTDDFMGKIIFLENYNIQTARALVSGCDVWLNNPIRPMEASGTSGMKASINGLPNCSILDGWWEEGCVHGENGWAIGGGQQFENRERQDMVDAEQLYDLIEEQIIPAFYKRDEKNLPQKWVAMMKASIKSVAPVFNTHRMVKEYTEKMYIPMAQRALVINENNYAKAHSLAVWKKNVADRFAGVRIEEVVVDGLDSELVKLGTKLNFRAKIYKGKMEADELRVEVITQTDENQEINSIYELACEKSKDDYLIYSLEFTPNQSGAYHYGLRVMPVNADGINKYEAGLVYWS